MTRRSKAQWQSLFAEQAASGLSSAAFCKEHNVCPKYFSLRRKQLASAPAGVEKRSAFITAQAPKADPIR